MTSSTTVTTASRTSTTTATTGTATTIATMTTTTTTMTTRITTTTTGTTTDREHDEGAGRSGPPLRSSIQLSLRGSADLLLQLVVEGAHAGIDTRLAGPSASLAPRDHTDQLVARDQRPAGVALAGVLAAVREAGADHAVRGVRRTVRRVALLVRGDRHVHLHQVVGLLAALGGVAPTQRRHRGARLVRRVVSGGQLRRRLIHRFRQRQDGDVVVAAVRAVRRVHPDVGHVGDGAFVRAHDRATGHHLLVVRPGAVDAVRRGDDLVRSRQRATAEPEAVRRGQPHRERVVLDVGLFAAHDVRLDRPVACLLAGSPSRRAGTEPCRTGDRGDGCRPDRPALAFCHVVSS